MQPRAALPRTLVLLAVLIGAPAAHAGGGQAPDGAPEILDLPVSLDRIQRLLERLPTLEESEGLLRLNIQVRVYAPAPPLLLYKGIDLQQSPPRYGAPVHTEMMALTTPSRFRFSGRAAQGLNTGHGLSWGGR